MASGDGKVDKTLDILSSDFADDGMFEQHVRTKLVEARETLKVQEYFEGMQGFFDLHGLMHAPPDPARVFDQDGDGWPTYADNCAQVFNASQSDFDNDAKGDACDFCPGDPEDMDGDGYDDSCDNCPDVYNPDPPQEIVSSQFPLSDIDKDGLGNACDFCPQVAGTGATAEETCCDPREPDPCLKTHTGSTILYACSSHKNYKFTCEVEPLGTYGCGPYNHHYICWHVPGVIGGIKTP
ncbi:MAG: thrombospondin type 3 repeat-containing protein, partial [Nannocystaceae bacterium]